MAIIFSFIKKHQFLFVLMLAIVYQLLCILQGFDLSDEGWAMYFYQQIFTNPEAVGAQMPYWFTGIVGGLWYKLFPVGGFFLTRLLGVAMVTTTFYLTYRFLRKAMNPSLLLLGLFVQILIVAGDPKPFGYNSLSAFFVLISIILLFNGMEKRNFILLFGGGFLLGINVFVRIPNIACLFILLLIPIYTYAKYGRINIVNVPLIIAISGSVLAVFLVIFVMKELGHWNLFLESFSSTINSASDQTNSHQLGRMLFRYIKNYWGILAVGTIVIVIGIAYVALRKCFSHKYYRILLLLFTATLLSFLSVKYNKVLRNDDMYFIHFVSYLSIILVFINIKCENYFVKFVAFASLLMILLMPLGSDQGIITFWASSWLSFPFAIAYLFKHIRDFCVKIHGNLFLINEEFSRDYFIIVCVVMVTVGIYKNDCCAYYDPGNRFEKVYAVNNTYARLIYTNSYRARLMNELLPALSKFVRPNDYLMVYDFMPGINYLTETCSYLPNSWLWCYSGEELELKIENSIKQKKLLPVVLRQHFVTINRWGDFDPSFFNEERPNNAYFKKKRTQVINKFLAKYGYKTSWTNNYFEILLPDPNSLSGNDYACVD